MHTAEKHAHAPQCAACATHATHGERLLDAVLRVDAPAPAPRAQGALLGRCLCAEHPEDAARMLVAYEVDGRARTSWLMRLATVEAELGDRVLLAEPANWHEAIVIGAIAEGRGSRPAPKSQPPHVTAAGQTVEVCTSEAARVLSVSATDERVTLTFHQQDVEIAARGALRLSGERVEIAAHAGPVRLSSSDDVVVRGQCIRLN